MIVDQLYRGPHYLWAQEMWVYRLELRQALAEAAIDLDEFPDPEEELRRQTTHHYTKAELAERAEKAERARERREDILEALRCDRTLADIAEEFGVTRQAVSLLAIRNGLRRRDHRALRVA